MGDFDLKWSDLQDNLEKYGDGIKEPDWFKYLKQYLEKTQFAIKSNTILKRARIYKGEFATFEWLIMNWAREVEAGCMQKEDFFRKIKNLKGADGGIYDTKIKEVCNGYIGYNETKSSAPSIDKTKANRFNKKGESYLYLCDLISTCIQEIKPNCENWVSIGDFKVIDELKMADLSLNNNYVIEQGDFSSKQFLICLHSALSQICEKEEDYLRTQYVSKYIKNLGYDGIIYNSSIGNNEKCYVVFYPEKCKCIRSNISIIKNITYEINSPLEELNYEI